MSRKYVVREAYTAPCGCLYLGEPNEGELIGECEQCRAERDVDEALLVGETDRWVALLQRMRLGARR